MSKMTTISMFGLSIANSTLASATDAIIEQAKRHEAGLIVTPNIDHIITLKNNARFFQIYKRASLITADGMPLVWLSKLLPQESLPERVTGADLLIAVCAKAAINDLSVAFIGGLPGVANEASEIMMRRYPGLRAVLAHCPPFGFEKSEEQTQEVITLCQQFKPDIVFFGVGAPKQELWGDAHLADMGVGPILCIGEGLSFASGRVPRAPKWMQDAGLEWFFRLAKDPKRLWKRYLIRDSLFLIYALQELCLAWYRKLFGNSAR